MWFRWRANYLEDAYHDFIGFAVATDLLNRAFHKTYTLDLEDQFGSLDLAVKTFRFSVRGLIPEMTKVAWQLKKDDIQKLHPDMTEKKFLFLMPRKKYEAEWGSDYRKPGFFAKLLAFVIRILPKFGPLKALAFKPPTPEVEKIFLESYAATIEIYRSLLNQEKAGKLDLVNKDLDTGRVTHFGEYHLADKTYARLTDKLAKKSFQGITPKLREEILEFFANMKASSETKKHIDHWRRLLREIQILKSLQLEELPASGHLDRTDEEESAH